MASTVYIMNTRPLDDTDISGNKLIKKVERSPISVDTVTLLTIDLNMESWAQLERLSRLVRNKKGSKQIRDLKPQWLGIYAPRPLIEWLKDTSIKECKHQIISFLASIKLLDEYWGSDFVEREIGAYLEEKPDLKKMADFFNTLEPSKEMLEDKLFRIHRKLGVPKWLSEKVKAIEFVGTMAYLDELGAINKTEFKVWKRAYSKGERLVGYKPTKAGKKAKGKASNEIKKEASKLFPDVGEIVLLRAGNTRKYKISYLPKSKDLDEWIFNLQEGSFEKLSVVGAFGTKTKKSILIIENLLGQNAVGYGWFNLKKAQVENLLNLSWRDENGIW